MDGRNVPQDDKSRIWQTNLWFNIILNGEKLSCPCKIRKKTRMPTLATLIQNSIGRHSQSNEARKRNRRCSN